MSERPPARCSTMLRSDFVAPLSSTQTSADPGFRPFRPELILAPLHGPECVVGGDSRAAGVVESIVGTW